MKILKSINQEFVNGFQDLTTFGYSKGRYVTQAEQQSVKNVVEVALRLFCPIKLPEILHLVIPYIRWYEIDSGNDMAICGTPEFCLPGF